MSSSRQKRGNVPLSKWFMASAICTVLCIAGIQIYFLLRRFMDSHGNGPTQVFRSSLPPSMDAMQHTVELVYVQPTTTRRPEAIAQRFRVSSWHVPSTTKGAATKAVGRLATNPKFTTAGKEQEYDELVQSLHSSGRIGNARHTPAMRQRTVQDLPTLKVSAKLAHAAEIGMHQASHGYQLTAGIKPKTRFTQEHLSMLKRIQAGSNDSWK